VSIKKEGESMALADLKFAESDFAGRDVSSLPDVPSQEGITAEELKARFDSVPKLLIALGAFNTLLDVLGGSGGAGEIGIEKISGMPAATVQEALSALSRETGKKLDRDNTVAYTPAGDYSPATKKYVDDAIASALGKAAGA
jgi:hypothetical protein